MSDPATNKCGTDAGYQVHLKASQDPCPACRRAHAAYIGRWRAQKGQTKTASVPYDVLTALLDAAPDELREWAESRLAASVGRTLQAPSALPDTRRQP